MGADVLEFSGEKAGCGDNGADVCNLPQVATTALVKDLFEMSNVRKFCWMIQDIPFKILAIYRKIQNI